MKKYRFMIETSNICNARCAFCANPKLHRKKEVMPDEIFDTILSKIHVEKIDVEKFILHLNGEPFTDSKLISRIKRLKSEFKDAQVWFTTNLNLPSYEDIDDLLISGVDTVTISINSTNAEEYRKIMGLDYSRTMNNLAYLLEKNNELNNPINIRTSIVDTGADVSVDEFRKKYSNISEIRVIKMGNWGGHEHDNEIVHDNFDINRCEDLNTQICILSNGDFALCCFDAEGMVGKNIKDGAIMDIFNGGEYLRVRTKLKENGKEGLICDTCSFTYK